MPVPGAAAISRLAVDVEILADDADRGLLRRGAEHKDGDRYREQETEAECGTVHEGDRNTRQ